MAGVVGRNCKQVRALEVGSLGAFRVVARFRGHPWVHGRRPALRGGMVPGSPVVLVWGAVLFGGGLFAVGG